MFPQEGKDYDFLLMVAFTERESHLINGHE